MRTNTNAGPSSDLSLNGNSQLVIETRSLAPDEVYLTPYFVAVDAAGQPVPDGVVSHYAPDTLAGLGGAITICNDEYILTEVLDENDEVVRAMIDLSKVPIGVERIRIGAFMMATEQAENLSQFETIMLDLLDSKYRKLGRQTVATNDITSSHTAIAFGELYRQDGGWLYLREVKSYANGRLLREAFGVESSKGE